MLDGHGAGQRVLGHTKLTGAEPNIRLQNLHGTCCGAEKLGIDMGVEEAAAHLSSQRQQVVGVVHVDLDDLTAQPHRLKQNGAQLRHGESMWWM